MVVGSLFSGIGGFDLGLERAGHEIRWQVEIDKNCQSVLDRHFGHGAEPSAPRQQRSGTARFNDIRTVWEFPAVDLVCGGFPCQDLSVAGKRAGLAGERSGLWHEFRRVVAQLTPHWVLVENVPGLLSSNAGADFAVVLRGLVELGYGVAWRILDAQYFGVAQRRRRVFVVGCLGSAARAAAVLFEPESCDGDTPPSRSTREGLAASLTSGSGVGSNNPGRRREDDVNLVAGTLGGGSGTRGRAPDTDRMTFLPDVTTALLASADNGYDMDGTGRGTPIIPALAHTLSSEGADAGEDGTGRGTPLIASLAVRGRKDGQEWELGDPGIGNALRAGDGGSSRSNWLLNQMAVRRLTPTECERLQGFPDGWTAGHSDSGRYRMLGNAVCVPVAEWIGKRMVAYHMPAVEAATRR